MKVQFKGFSSKETSLHCDVTNFEKQEEKNGEKKRMTWKKVCRPDLIGWGIGQEV